MAKDLWYLKRNGRVISDVMKLEKAWEEMKKYPSEEVVAVHCAEGRKYLPSCGRLG